MSYAPLAEEIWEQSGGTLDAFVQSVGTAQCLAGVATVLGPGRTVATLACDSGLEYLSTDLYSSG